jgi:gas vesicle protein
MARKSDLLVGLLVGAAIGAGVALLYAPRPGAELRSVVGRKAGEIVDRGRQMVRQAGQKEAAAPAEEGQRPEQAGEGGEGQASPSDAVA